MPPFKSVHNDAEFQREYRIMCEILNRLERYLVRELVLKE